MYPEPPEPRQCHSLCRGLPWKPRPAPLPPSRAVTPATFKFLCLLVNNLAPYLPGEPWPSCAPCGCPSCEITGTEALTPAPWRGGRTPAPGRAPWQPPTWQPGGVGPGVRLGRTPARLSPACSLTAWGAPFLIVGGVGGACWQLPACPLLAPLPAVSKSEPLTCCPQCPGWSERSPPSFPLAFCWPSYRVTS